MAGKAEEAVTYEAAGGGRSRPVMSPDGRGASLGRAARARRRRATAPSSPTSSSARRSTARSSPRPGSTSPRPPAGSTTSRALPLTEKRRAAGEPRRRGTRSARTSASTPAEIVRIYSTSGTTGTPSYIPLTAADLDNWVTGSARSYAASGVARRASASSRPTTPGRSSPARRSPRSSGSGSATSRSAPATPSG